MVLDIFDHSQLTVLRNINIVAAVLHACLALSALSVVLDKGAIEVPVFWGTAQWNSTECALQGYGESVPVCPNLDPEADGRHQLKLNFSVLLICSQCITTAGHILQAWLSRPGTWFVRWVFEYGIKAISWGEYVFTAALTNHVLLYYSGQLDIRAQIIGYAAQGTLMIIGLTQDLFRHWSLTAPREVSVCKIVIVGLFVLGFFNLMSVWFPSLYVLWFNTPADQTPPSFVKWIVLFEFLLYSSFGFVQLYFFVPYILKTTEQYTPRYLQEQLVLDGLSFLSKLLLNVAFSTCFVYQVCGGDE